MVRFGLEGGLVFGEDPWTIGDETSGKENESKEGGNESDRSKDAEELEFMKLR
jgi:hypothetical protein